MTNENLKDEMKDPQSDTSKSALNGGDGQDSEQFSVSIHLWCVLFLSPCFSNAVVVHLTYHLLHLQGIWLYLSTFSQESTWFFS
jgi:hypothetical protein